MKRTRLAISIILLLCFLLGAHLAAFPLRLYWFLWWYDGLLHFMAGVVLGLTYVYFLSLIHPNRSRFTNLFLFTAWVAAIGIGWEVFEYVFDISSSIEGYALDTATDIVADTIGAIFGYIMGLRMLGMWPVVYKKFE